MLYVETQLYVHMEDIPQTEQGRLITRRQIAARYSVSERTIQNWMRGKMIPWIQVSGRLIRFSPSETDAALTRNHRVAARGETVGAL